MKIVDKYLDNIQQESVTLLAFSAASLFITAYNTYKNYLTKAARKCKDLPPREKAICMLNTKIEAKKVEFQTIKTGSSKCKDEKCKAKVQKKLLKISNDIKFLSNRFKELRSQKY